ncbi:MAG: hypothetical protein HY280_08675 [Nitrospinae bacterium]|nr:hypothetical protein [Nitrospinota bacterium]
MVRKLISAAVVALFLSPVLVFAHAGHEHASPVPKVEAPPPTGTPAENARLMRENAALKAEIEKERINNAKILSRQATGRAEDRSKLIIVGLLLGAGVVVARYLPGGNEK